MRKYQEKQSIRKTRFLWVSIKNGSKIPPFLYRGFPRLFVLAGNVNVVGRDNVGRLCNLLYLAVGRICNAVQEIEHAERRFRVEKLNVENNRAAVDEIIGNSADLRKVLRVNNL